MTNIDIKFFPLKELNEYKFNSGEIYVKTMSLEEGGFSKVLKAVKKSEKDLIDSKQFIIKINRKFTFQKATNQSDNAEVVMSKEINFMDLREISLLKGLNHPNIMRLIEVKICRNTGDIWQLMEYYPTDLHKFIMKIFKDEIKIDEEQLKNICRSILEGVKYLHSKSIVHRDLKPGNIMYDPVSKALKIGDFGLSRKLEYKRCRKYSNVGTYPYKPPEVVMGYRNYSTEFDIWSLGCIFAEICIGTPLFGTEEHSILPNQEEIFGTIDEKKVGIPNLNYPNHSIKKEGIGIKGHFSKFKLKFKFKDEKFFDLLEKMLDLCPERRIKAEACLNHPWFSSKISKNN